MKLKRKLKVLLPVSMMVLGISTVGSYELVFKDKINTTDVIVAKQDIKFKSEITKDDIQVVSIRKDIAVHDALKPEDVELVLNKHASIDIKKGTQIYSKLVDTYNLIPNEQKGEFIAPIPDSWLFAVPGSLRKTYIADFYLVPDKDQAVIRSLVQDSKENEGKKDKEPLETDENSDVEVMRLAKPILQNVRVASVKDNGNKEVTETQEDQQNATGSVSNIEVIADQKMLNKLKDYTSQGYKIYVVYKFGR